MFEKRNHQLLSVPLVLIVVSLIFLNTVAGQASCTTLNGRSGICIPILQCKFIEQLLRRAPKPLPSQVIQYIRQSHCGTFNGQHYACCDQRRQTSPVREQPQSPQQDPSKSPVLLKGANIQPGITPDMALTRSGLSVLNSENAECNLFRGTVANGEDAGLMEYRWVALLVYDDGVSKTLECGGSLISNRHVLTAAHCILVREPKQLVAARLGEFDIRSEIDCAHVNGQRICAPAVQDIDIANAVYHKDYAPSRFANDIGLLRLRTEAVLNSAVNSICLPVETHRKDLPSELTVAGWGHTEGGTRADILQKATLPIVNSDTCQKVYKIIPISDKHLCAGGVNETQSCRGDSGGPLFASFQYVQHGIVSGGSRKCGTNFPDVYTRVEPYIPWISTNIAALM